MTCAPLVDLLARHLERARVVLGLDQPAELRRAGDVGALAHVHEQAVGPEVERLESGEPAARLEHGGPAWRQARDRLRHVGDVLRRGPAAAAHDVHEAALGVVADQGRGLAGGLVVLAERVRQPGVGVGADVGIRDAGKLLDVGTQLFRAERAVEADHFRPRVAHRVPERLDCLPGKRATRGVGDRAGDHHRQVEPQFVEHPTHREQRRLGIQRVEHGLDQDEIHAALHQRARRLGVGRGQLVEADVAERGVADVRRERGGAAGGTEGARDEARPPGARRHLVGGATRDLRRGQVELAHQRLGAVVGLGGRVRVEGVGLDDVGAGLEIAAVDLADHLGTGQHQQVVVALEVTGPVAEPLAAVVGLAEPVGLDDGAHRAVEHQDALAQQAAELADPFGSQHGQASEAARATGARTPSAWQMA